MKMKMKMKTKMKMTLTTKHSLALGSLLSVVFLFMVSPTAISGGGHDHGAPSLDEEHAHEESEAANVVTQFNEYTELFLEFPPLVVNEKSTFVTHFTTTADFKPIINGTLDVVLKDGEKTMARFKVREPARKGIFLPDVVPNKAGQFNVLLELNSIGMVSVHDIGLVTVFPTKAKAYVELEAEEGEITYLKEQQWVNPYAVTKASNANLRSSVPGFGTVSPPLNEFSIIRAADDGYFKSDQFFTAGSDVTTGDLLGQLIPRLGEDSDVGDLIIETQKAKSEFELAQADVKRLEKLFESGVVSEKSLQEAQKHLEDSQVEYNTTQSRVNQRTSGQGTSGFQIRSPINGSVLETHVLPGSFIREGDALFTVSGNETRWLKVQVPEVFGAKIQKTSGVWFEHGNELISLITNENATLINTSEQVIHPTRTIETVLAYSADFWPGIMGSRLPVNVFVGQPEKKLAIPVTSIVDDSGVPVVYVQKNGESFERRVVSIGIRDGSMVEITGGLKTDEWVVSKGAYFVKLASASGDSIGHGHAH
jgi:RND family efflux transporter MFP subunit